MAGVIFTKGVPKDMNLHQVSSPLVFSHWMRLQCDAPWPPQRRHLLPPKTHLSSRLCPGLEEAVQKLDWPASFRSPFLLSFPFKPEESGSKHTCVHCRLQHPGHPAQPKTPEIVTKIVS